jgi:xanthine/uracil permease
MAGHVRFGAHTTGGALVILGAVLLIATLFLADSIGKLLRLFPMPVLGVILFFSGLELASSVASEGFSQAERTVLVMTAGIALWNMGAAYLGGLALHHAWERRLIRL